MKLKSYILSIVTAGTLLGVSTSCQDMLDMGNDYVIYTGDQLVNPQDTVTSMMGILNKLQAIGVRTNLLGEVRADLVVVNENATSDLKNLASFSANVTGDYDSNIYNNPSDYYAVINNCNYFLKYASPDAGNKNRNEKYFEYEIAQVHSIRAWVYLQLVLNYGQVPFVTEPVLSKQESDADYPMYDLNAICDYFIQDLKPYYGKRYPDYGSIGGDVDPKKCFFPTQVVMGDLYLWKAANNQDREAAKQAAKSYYDYIMWHEGGKEITKTGSTRVYWSPNSLFTGQYSNITPGLYYENINVIPMDSATSDGYYNDLKNLYNFTSSTSYSEASISPSKQLRALSESQIYYAGYDLNNGSAVAGTQYLVNVTEMEEDGVTPKHFSSDDIKEGLFGDLRFKDSYSSSETTLSSQLYNVQNIWKHTSQHIGIYTTSQLYLKLAEALNYAGYPRFSKLILSTGVCNNLINACVNPYYLGLDDAAFLSYFDFSDSEFLTRIETASLVKNKYGVYKKTSYIYRAFNANYNTLGIHCRGCGDAFLNPYYAQEVNTIDSVATGYPAEEEASIGEAPKEVKKPSTWDKYPGVVVTKEQYKELNPKSNDRNYNNYVNNDSVAKYAAYLEALGEFNQKVEDFQVLYKAWVYKVYSDPEFVANEQMQVDKLILDEQALEQAYEGTRYYDLMRHSMWNNDNSIINDAIQARGNVNVNLMDRKNWYLNWKGKIGY